MAKTKYGQRMYRARKKAGGLRTAAQTSMLETIEDNLYTRKTEHVAFVDDNGKIVAHKTDHNKGSVNLSGISHRAVRGTVATHNHPTGSGADIGGCFSPADLSQVDNFNLKGIRAAGVEGTYEVIKNSPNADAYGLAVAYGLASGRICRQITPTFKKAQSDYNNGKITFSQCCDIFKSGNESISTKNSRWLAKHASEYGFTYTFTQRK